MSPLGESIALVLIVFRQLREGRLTARTILLPVALMAWAGFTYLKAIPTAVRDVAAGRTVLDSAVQQRLIELVMADPAGSRRGPPGRPDRLGLAHGLAQKQPGSLWRRDDFRPRRPT